MSSGRHSYPWTVGETGNEEKSKLALVTIDHPYLVVTTKHHIQLFAVKDRVLDEGVDFTHDISERGE